MEKIVYQLQVLTGLSIPIDFSGTSLFGDYLTWEVGKQILTNWNLNFGNGYIEQTAVSSAGTNASNNGIFEYDVPTGFTALSTKGLNFIMAYTTINKSIDLF